jgi:hypothetical protein
MTSPVTASTPDRFLSLVPHLLGFAPRRSIVLVPFDGRSSLGAMRLDLPPTGPDETERVASDYIGLVCRLPDADGFAMVAYTDAGRRADGAAALPYEGLARALLDRADACGLHVVELLCVGTETWASFREPLAEHPLAELPVPDEALPPVRGDHTSGTRLPRIDPRERERVVQALEGIRAASRVLLDGGRGKDRARRVDPRAIVALGVLDDLPQFFERCLAEAPARLDPQSAATLSWCLSQPGMRDVALLCWTDGPVAGERALDAQLRWYAGEPYPPEIGLRMWGDGPRPDPDRLGRALALARRIAAVTPPADRAPAFAVCAWLSWALGRSTHAGIYVERALRCDRRHGLTEIMASFLAVGHLPDWAFRPRERTEALT